MRLALALLLFAACDLQPPKRDKLAASLTPPPASPAMKVDLKPAAGSAAPAPPPPRPRPAPMAITPDCEKVAVHVTNIVIAGIADATLRAAQEQDRTKLVRKIAETCTKDKWSDAARKCFLDGKTGAELEVCGKRLAAPKPDQVR